MSMREVESIVDEVEKDSPAARAGILPGDRILSINGHKINDAIDLMFYGDEQLLNIQLARNGKRFRVEIEKDSSTPLGIRLKPLKVKRCKNRCIFCFVNQLPRGLRKTLYIKDEDFRMSFLYGNYITLTNLTKSDKRRIIEQRLSPLYISVHSTDPEVRNRLLGNKNAPDIMSELSWLADNRIRMHTQIVVCPGYNDGENLRQSIQDLGKLYPYVQSIAVVPVGVTRFVRTDIRPLTKEDSEKALKIVHEFQKKFMKKYGDPIVYGSDELYIKAKRRFPPLKYYGDFPQIENGVGMVPLFLHRAKRLKISKRFSDRRFLAITGVSFYPFLREFINKIRDQVSIDLLSVENKFFGETVTVTGLLTGRDIIRKVSEVDGSYDALLIPDVTVREGKDLLIDDVSIRDLSRILSMEVMVVKSDPVSLIKALGV
jgi:putative radical SAM enzyme (TIGR03279 family)